MRWAQYLLSRLSLRSASAAGRRKSRPGSRRVRPVVELLEDRLTPSALQLSLSPHSIVEAPGPSSTAVGTVTRVNTDNTQPLTVALSSSNNAEVSFPSSVVIPAGQASTTFNVSAVLDSAADGTQNVTITGTAQVTAPTALDPTFGGTGSVAQGYLTSAVAIQPDGKIVTAGMRYNGTSPNYWDFAVSRYNPDGSLDATFGGAGTVITDLSGQSDQPHAVVIQPDGKIVVGGIGGNGPHFFWELARYNADGSLDASFGNGGKVITNPNPSGYYNEIWDLALQSDGKILAAGDMDVGSDGEFAVARYNTNGTLDTTFGSGGIATSNPTVGYSDRAFSVVVQPTDGKIILAGGSKGGNFDSHFAVSRFTPSGVLDTSFGGTGTVVTDVPGSYEQGQDAVLQPDGKLVVVGYVSPAGVYPTVNNFALVRYNPNGSLDTSFGYQGFTITDFGGNDSAQRVALQPDGRIEVVGSGVGTTLSTSRTIVAWYTPSGVLGGSLAGPNVGVLGEDVALQPDGGIVAVSQQGAQFGGYVERYYDTTLISGSDTVAVQDPTAPVALDDSYPATENTPLTVSAAAGVLVNDTDFSGASLTAIQLSNPANGTATLNGDDSFTYTPNTGFFGTDSFTYKDNDGTLDSNVATVTITVTAPAPTANNDSYSVNENNTLTVQAPGVLANDTDPDNNPLSAVLVTKPAHGTLQFAADGSFVYTPTTYFYGTDSFTYEAFNGSTYSSPATVSITVNYVNQPPTAVNDAYSLNENGSLSIQKPGVLANDSDPDNDPITAVLSAGPSHGTLTLNADGSFVYAPNTGFYGTDSFTYRAFDGNLYSNVATVTLTVNAVPPTANNDAYSVNENDMLTVGAPGVLANDTATTSDALSASVVSSPAHGTLTLNADGSFTYKPAANFYGTDSFTYHDAESGMTSNTATVAITVNFVDQPPVAVDDSYAVNEDSSLNVTLPQGGTTSLYLNSQPGDYIGQGQTNAWTTATGSFTASRNFDNGVSFSYQDANPSVWWYLDFAAPYDATLTPGYYGGATRYPFQASSQPGLDVRGEGRGSNTLTGAFTVVQAYYGSSGQVLYFDATFEQHNEGASPALFGEIKYTAPNTPVGVLANDYDPDGQAITAALVSGPSHGSLTLNADGTFSYKPNEDYVGTDSFTYVANDGTLNSNVATVTLTVNPVNEAPSFVKGPDQTIVEGAGPQTVPGWATSISPGPPNESNQTLNFLVSTNNGALFSVAPAIDPTTGTLTYTPAPGVLGSATVTVRLHDNGGTANGGVDTSQPQTVTITVNDATPTFTLSGPSSVDEGSLYTLALAANDPDAVTGWTVTWGDGNVQPISGNPS
ncbi:MAG TPA: Ig-like domain-containing protein, partial [Gemmataceae bacterium]|nr:Ig-like domain-containing protein [Gemmataceae bacterium]